LFFKVNSKDVGEGSICVTIDQNGEKLKPDVKVNDKDGRIYDVCFTPENDSQCRVEIEFTDNSDNFIYGDAFDVVVKAANFIISPSPINPVQINYQCVFRGMLLLFFYWGFVNKLLFLKSKLFEMLI
jgi:hypothetical protein